MKKWKNALVLTLASLALGACGEVSSSESNSPDSSVSEVVSSTDDSVSSSSDETFSSSDEPISSSSEATSDWTEEEKALMVEYCGGVLPHPGSKMTGKITFEEMEDSNGSKFLVIYDEGTSFTLETYYKDLEKNGWNLIKGYNGSATQSDSTGIKFVELTNSSEDKTKGFDMVYYFSEGSSSSDSRNIIQCYNDLCATKTDATEWDEDEKEAMATTICTELPFIQLGSSNRVYSYSRSILAMIDVYTEDLTATYVAALVADGWKENKIESISEGSYVLNKTLSDGAILEAVLYYMNGNSFYFSYTPKVDTFISWPKEQLATYETAAGVEIPELTADEGGSYYVFKKNGTLYIQIETTEIDSYSYAFDLGGVGFISSGWSDPYTNWLETVAIQVDDIYDDDYNTIGVQLAFSLTEPTSTFTETWPSEKIDDVIKNTLGVSDYSFPELEDISLYTDDKIKYEVTDSAAVEAWYEYYVEDITTYPDWYADLPIEYTDDDIKALARSLAEAEAGITITVKDKDELATGDAYDELLESLGYHKGYAWSGTLYEDKDGKVQINVDPTWYEDYSCGVTVISIKKGSGETHEPTLEFASESYEIGIGKTQKLQVNKDMLPYDVSYSSSNPDKISVNQKGFVTVSSDAVGGDSATITASVTTSTGEVISATCTVTAKEVLDYDKESAIAVIQKTLQENGYADATIQRTEDDDPFIKMTFDLSDESNTVTLDSLVEFADGNLIPTGFEGLYSMDVDTGDDVWGTIYRYENGEEIGKGKSLNCEFYYDEDEEPKVELIFYVYTLYSDPNTLVFEVFSYDSDII